MASLQAFDGGHSGLAVKECQFTEGTTSFKSGNVYKTRIDNVDRICSRSICLKLEGIIMDCFDSEGQLTCHCLFQITQCTLINFIRLRFCFQNLNSEFFARNFRRLFYIWSRNLGISQEYSLVFFGGFSNKFELTKRPLIWISQNHFSAGRLTSDLDETLDLAGLWERQTWGDCWSSNILARQDLGEHHLSLVSSLFLRW